MAFSLAKIHKADLAAQHLSQRHRTPIAQLPSESAKLMSRIGRGHRIEASTVATVLPKLQRQNNAKHLQYLLLQHMLQMSIACHWFIGRLILSTCSLISYTLQIVVCGTANLVFIFVGISRGSTHPPLSW